MEINMNKPFYYLLTIMGIIVYTYNSAHSKALVEEISTPTYKGSVPLITEDMSSVSKNSHAVIIPLTADIKETSSGTASYFSYFKDSVWNLLSYSSSTLKAAGVIGIQCIVAFLPINEHIKPRIIRSLDNLRHTPLPNYKPQSPTSSPSLLPPVEAFRIHFPNGDVHHVNLNELINHLPATSTEDKIILTLEKSIGKDSHSPVQLRLVLSTVSRKDEKEKQLVANINAAA